MKLYRISVFMMIGILVFGISARAQEGQTIPDLINYQGKLMDGTNLYNGLVEMSFRLYDAEIGGALHYEASNTVAVVDGLYSTFIGDNDYSANSTTPCTRTRSGSRLKLTVRLLSRANGWSAWPMRGLPTGCLPTR